MECIAVHHNYDAGPIFIAMFIMFLIFALLIIIAIKILIMCKIFSKAGYSWALGLLMLVPIANIVMSFFLAFADWPILKELRQLQQPASQRGEQQKKS